MTEQKKESLSSKPRKSPRRRAREFAVQGLFQWQMNPESGTVITAFLADSSPYFVKADQALFQAIFLGCLREMDALEIAMAPHLDREKTELSPVEHAILLTAVYELVYMPETPYAVVLNEAIELAKTYGGTDGHKFVNGVLDKVAQTTRPHESKANKKSIH